MSMTGRRVTIIRENGGDIVGVLQSFDLGGVVVSPEGKTKDTNYDIFIPLVRIAEMHLMPAGGG